MKKQLGIALATTATLFAATGASADVLGLTGRVNAAVADWDHHGQDSDSGFQGDVALRFEHPIPLVPNVALGAERKSQDFPGEGNNVNAELYYELLDGLGASLDAGLGYGHWDMEDDDIGDADSVYATLRGYFRLPISSLGVEASLKQHLNSSDVEQDRWRAGLTYDVLPFTTLALGYQQETMNLDDHEWDSKGGYLGLEIDF